MDLHREFPILEFDPTQEAILEPSKLIKPMDIPEHVVVCFFQDVISRLVQEHGAKVIKSLKSEYGTHPIYELEFEKRRLGLVHPGVGAPLAAGILEEVIALGARKFIACGGAGVLDREIAVGHVLVPLSAVRDEGTSYHYLPPGREVEASPVAVAALEKVLQTHEVPYNLIKTWTTDAVYRETREKVRRRKAEGCQAVEMEAATFFAVAQFRKVIFGQVLYGGDDVSGGGDWDMRDWTTHSIRDKLFLVAAQACLSL
jgi:uridine phosphorylase